MNITVNGQKYPIKEPVKLSSLLKELGFENKPVVVELNGVALPSSSQESQLISAGDILEIFVIFSGG